jgi:nucleoside-diphosphate-sugar epimerase
VNFLKPIEVGELVTMKASVNYVGRSSMIVGIRVEAENIQTGAVKHCNSSYFTMVAKDKEGKSVKVPGLILSNLDEVRRFRKCIKQIESKKEVEEHAKITNVNSIEDLASRISIILGNVGYEILGKKDFGWNLGRYVPDISLIKSELNLEKKVSLEDAILRTAIWNGWKSK